MPLIRSELIKRARIPGLKNTQITPESIMLAVSHLHHPVDDLGFVHDEGHGWR